MLDETTSSVSILDVIDCPLVVVLTVRSPSSIVFSLSPASNSIIWLLVALIVRTSPSGVSTDDLNSKLCVIPPL